MADSCHTEKTHSLSDGYIARHSMSNSQNVEDRVTENDASPKSSTEMTEDKLAAIRRDPWSTEPTDHPLNKMEGSENTEDSLHNGTVPFQDSGGLDVVDDDGLDELQDGSDSGADSDMEDNVDVPYPGVHVRRVSHPDLPDTVTALETDDGSKIYLVGTAHFSESSQDDVSKTIEQTQPDVVMVELCNSRVNILQLDEATLLEEAKNINLEKIRTAIKQSGVLQGIMHILLLSMSAHLTKQLGMAPGGEFRRAFREAQKIPGCRVYLGDRPIQITLRRALSALSIWQKTMLAWYMITSNEPISKEEVEKCKQRDLLEEMLREMTGEFPALSEVFVKERDIFLAHSLRLAAQPIPHPLSDSGQVPAVVVGVVGIGHVPGIVENWDKEKNVKDLMTVPPATIFGTTMKWALRAGMVGLLSWGCYKLYRLTSYVLVLTYQNVPFKLPLK